MTPDKIRAVIEAARKEARRHRESADFGCPCSLCAAIAAIEPRARRIKSLSKGKT